MSKLTAAFRYELKDKPILSLCVAGASITRLASVLFSTYLILWIQHFADTGVLKSRAQGKTIYMNVMLISVTFAAMVLPVIGKLCDQFNPRDTMPYAFILRGVSTILFWGLEAPDTFAAYSVCSLIIIATTIESMIVDAIFYKAISKETRGILTGAYAVGG